MHDVSHLQCRVHQPTIGGASPCPTILRPGHRPPVPDNTWTNVTSTPPTKPWWQRWWGIALIGFAVLVLIGVLAGNPDDTNGDSAADDPDLVETVDDETDDDPEPEPAPKPETEPEPDTDITVGQENALRSAQDYLRLSGCSRTGLIEQLEFDGYTTDEATFAVDNLDADWKEQAARSAQDYLDISGFSRTGLIDQLEFDGYTRDEAEYGATQAGL